MNHLVDININGTIIPVRIVPNLSFGGYKVLGTWDPCDKVIDIREFDVDTIFHEIIHALIQLRFCYRFKTDQDEDEFIYHVQSVVYNLLRHNRKLLAWLIEELDRPHGKRSRRYSRTSKRKPRRAQTNHRVNRISTDQDGGTGKQVQDDQIHS